MEGEKIIKHNKALPDFITQEEFEKLFAEIIIREKKASPRRKKRLKQYRLAILLGFEAGMRISEIVGLKELISKCHDASLTERRIEENGRKLKYFFCSVCHKKLISQKDYYRGGDWRIFPLNKKQIDLKGHSIKIIGKGGKERVTFLSKRFNNICLEMLPLTISRRALQTFIESLGKNILHKSIHFHSLRHGFCSFLAGKGIPLHEIQMLAGHANLSTTGIYLHANPKIVIDKIKEVF